MRFTYGKYFEATYHKPLIDLIGAVTLVYWPTLGPNRSTGLKQIKIGDELLVYIKKMRLVGIFKVNREYFYDAKKIWKDGIFPHRIGFEPTDKVLSHPVDIRSMYNEQIKPKKVRQADIWNGHQKNPTGGIFIVQINYRKKS